MIRFTVILLIACALTMAAGFSQTSRKPVKKAEMTGPLVTFVELGSVRCIPCREMQPVMKAIETKYGDQVKVVFHDVWTDTGRTQAEVYKIRLIPTQVFLDAKGKEFHRHEGFYPEEEIHRLLRKRGLRMAGAGS